MMDERLKQFAGFALALVMTTCMGIHFGEAAAMETETKKPPAGPKPGQHSGWRRKCTKLEAVTSH